MLAREVRGGVAHRAPALEAVDHDPAHARLPAEQIRGLAHPALVEQPAHERRRHPSAALRRDIPDLDDVEPASGPELAQDGDVSGSLAPEPEIRSHQDRAGIEQALKRSVPRIQRVEAVSA